MEEYGCTAAEINTLLLHVYVILPISNTNTTSGSNTTSGGNATTGLHINTYTNTSNSNSNVEYASTASTAHDDIVIIDKHKHHALYLRRDWLRFITCCRLCIAHLIM